MVLKWSLVLVAAFIATVSAQSDSDTIIPTTTMQPSMATPMTTSMAAPMATPMASPEPAVGELPERFNMTLAEQIRADHFYCLGANGTREDFQTVTPTRWGLWLQYPVLSYLDSMRKRHLFYVISQMTAVQGERPIFNDICVAEVEHYAVSTYSESVFVKLYLLDQVERTSTQAEARYRVLDTRLRDNYNAANRYTEMLVNQVAINVNSTEPSDGGPILSNRTVNDSVLAGCDMDSCPDGDPTLLAVVLGTYIGPWYYPENGERREVTVELLRSGRLPDERFSRLGSLVNNPRPINFGLEAGDIVFAVFGSIFLTILSAAIVIGFCIHPYFFA